MTSAPQSKHDHHSTSKLSGVQPRCEGNRTFIYKVMVAKRHGPPNLNTASGVLSQQALEPGAIA